MYYLTFRREILIFVNLIYYSAQTFTEIEVHRFHLNILIVAEYYRKAIKS